MAILWAEKELEVDHYCLGEDHPDCRKEPLDESVTEWYSFHDPSADSCIMMSALGISRRCHGLGIVDNNELNSNLDYCSHRREYPIWRRKKKRKSI